MPTSMKRKANDLAALIEKEEDLHCNVCGVSCNSKIVMDSHLNGKKHKARESKIDKNQEITKEKEEGKEEEEEEEEKKGGGLWCEVCKVRCNSGVIMQAHLMGKKHKGKVDSERKKRKEKGFWCEVCEVSLNSVVLMDAHVKGKKHKAKEEKKLGGKEKRDAVVDEEGEGETVKGNPDDGEVEIMASGGEDEGEVDDDGGLVEEKKASEDDGGDEVMASECVKGKTSMEGKGELDGKKQEGGEEKEVLWCLRCKVKCDNKAMMAKHLNGVDHKERQAPGNAKEFDRRG